jgi:hypothetical protein
MSRLPERLVVWEIIATAEAIKERRTTAIDGARKIVNLCPSDDDVYSPFRGIDAISTDVIDDLAAGVDAIPFPAGATPDITYSILVLKGTRDLTDGRVFFTRRGFLAPS